MIAPRRLAPLPLLLAGLAVLTLVIALTVHAQSQEVTPTAAATGTDPPAKPTNLQTSAVHDSVTLTWTASTDQTVTHYAILRRNRDTDAMGVFHVIESNAGPSTSYTDSSVSASTQVQLPGEGGQPHRRQPVVGLRQSRHLRQRRTRRQHGYVYSNPDTEPEPESHSR